MLLNGTPFAFVIDLAALASRREYLKLDKWLTDKIREHGVKQDFPYLCTLSMTNLGHFHFRSRFKVVESVCGLVVPHFHWSIIYNLMSFFPWCNCQVWNSGLDADGRQRRLYFPQEPFIQACMTFLKRRCPSILGGLAPEKDQPKSAQLPPETLATMLACLQACAG